MNVGGGGDHAGQHAGQPPAERRAARQVGDERVELVLVAGAQRLIDAADEGVVGEPALDRAIPELVDRTVTLTVGGAERRLRRAHLPSIGLKSVPCPEYADLLLRAY